MTVDQQLLLDIEPGHNTTIRGKFVERTNDGGWRVDGKPFWMLPAALTAVLS